MSGKRKGGARVGAGRPTGSKGEATLEKEAAREYVRGRVTAQLGPLIDAQIANAVGLKYLVVRNRSTGKFVRVAEGQARTGLSPDEEIIEVWAKDPSVQAFTDLLNRALDKPKEQEFTVAHRPLQPDSFTVEELLLMRKMWTQRAEK